MDTYRSIAFHQCQLDLRARELRRDGQLLAIEPKVFDLIALLVSRPREAITKDELFRVLWPDRLVSDGALARVVMLARQAIGNASLIKTVHRVGYRFTGQLDELPVEARLPAGAARRISLLPVDNLSGDAQLAWTELGLPALILQGLEQPGALNSVGLADLLPAIGGLPAQTPPAEKARIACRLLGLAGCVQVSLRRQGHTLWLDYRTHGDGLPALSGSVCGGDPVELALQMARQLRQALLPTEPAASSQVLQDPFLQQAMARARQLTALHQFRPAAKLLDMVVEFEPDHLPARLALLQALADLGDPQAVPLGEQLAAQAAARDDRRLQAQALAASGHAQLLAEAPGALAQARRKLAQALEIAHPYREEDWAMRLQTATGRAALLEGDLVEARRLMLDMEIRAQATAHHFQLALALDHRAWIEWECGEWIKAHALMDRSIRIFLEHRLQGMAALTQMNQALSCVELGLLERGRLQAQQATQLLEHVQQPHALASLAEAAAQVFGALGQPALLDDLLTRIAAAPQGQAALEKTGGLIARGLQAQLQGRAASGRALLMQALALGQQSVIRRANRLRRLMEFELAVQDPDAMLTAQDLTRQCLQQHEHTGLRVLLLRTEASQALTQRDANAAQALLQQAGQLGGPSRQQAMARFDAAWLACAQGQPARAQTALQGLGPWLDEHPLGRRLTAALQGAEALALPCRLPSLG
ncbi:MAG: hypothetical protein DI603_03645 [Roseateles depolymerans]|uniref:OmpR/PhoB-type domain-containing protein n=1 Tax=Roseateles depolymerans TaxID=76731 RepID=A0A2W5G1P4_9BURK|nr:MAG: hypothetical protein DI603_03645 [Roseateles depolymerans]